MPPSFAVFDVVFIGKNRMGPRPSRLRYFWFLVTHPFWMKIEIKCAVKKWRKEK